jgi:outer membrane protein assembly factor BamB
MKRSLALLTLLFAAAVATAGDWSNWRGPKQTGVSDDTGLPAKFSANPKAKDSNVLWRVPYGGISDPIIQDGRVYVINKVGENLTQQERVMCFDAETGDVKWEHKFNVFLTDIVRDRLGWGHLAGDPETGNVYVHGTQGLLICFDKDGKILWQHSLTEEYGRVSGYGGRVCSPIVDEDLVIISMANASWGEQTVGGIRMAAFDKKTGAVRWWGWTDLRVYNTYYSCPTVAVINGERLVITGGGDGAITAFKVHTGEKVWSYKFGSESVNCTPVVEGDRIYCAHGEENENTTQGRVICVDGSKIVKGKYGPEPTLVWQVDGIKAKYASPALHKGKLYIPNEVGVLYCLNAEDGKQLWQYEYGKNTKGSPVVADGKIYITEVDARFHILEPKDTECAELASVFFRGRGAAPVELNGSPAIAHRKVYFMTSQDLYCIGLKDTEGTDARNPPPPQKQMAPRDAAPAHLQIEPADVTLVPGESQEFKAWAYDDKGQLIGPAEVEWELAGQLPLVFPVNFPDPPKMAPGAPPPLLKAELSEKTGATTKVTVSRPPPPGQFGRLVAKYKDLTNYSRVRVAVVPPFKADFSKVPVGRAPGGWVNTGGKFSVLKLPTGEVVLKKRDDAASPLVARAHAYIGLPTAKDYTIEVDVMGTKVRDELPDMGIDVQRYNLQLTGATQQLRLISWDALPRIDKSIVFPWKPDVWYSMKLTVDIQKDGKGLVHGKVWERGKPEPTDWTVEVEDPIPNLEGAPGLYGNSTANPTPKAHGTTVYYHNLRITPNK